MNSTMRVPAARKTPAKAIPTLLAAAALLLLGSSGMARAASPPQLLNYQGILRDANGLPLSGNYSMVFRLEEAGTGDEILIDEHLGGPAGTGVTVTNGLFNVQIGSGTVLDGGGPGSYTSLAEVFRDFNDIVLSIEVEGELLLPSIPIASAPFALNATHLDGLDQGKFLRTDVSGIASGNLWFSASPTGGTINDASVLIKPISANADETLLGVGVSLSEKFRVDAEGDTFIGGLLHMPNGARFWDNGFGLQIYGGDADTDDVLIRAGNSSDDGAITIVGDGLMEFRSGNGEFSFRDDFGNGGKLLWQDSDLTIVAGDDDTDDIILQAGDGSFDGQLKIRGGGPIFLSAADGNFYFSKSGGGDVQLNAEFDMTIGSTKNLIMLINQDGQGLDEAQWFRNNVLLLPEQLAELQEDGDFRISGQYENSVAFDLAESFLMVEPVEPGDLVSVDDSRADAIRLASGIGDTSVIGVVSTQPGVHLGSAPFEAESLRNIWGESLYKEFLLEREELQQKVLGSSPGLQRRLEATSRMQGKPEETRRLNHDIQDHALELFWRERLAPVALAGRVPVKVDAGYGSIRVGDLLTTSPTPGHAMRADDPKPGTVIGKALESLETGTGLIKVLVMLR